MGDRNHLQPPSSDYDAQTAHHEQDAAEREAYEYWGYLFKPDKTGTDKLKSLLRGLKEVMVSCPSKLTHIYTSHAIPDNCTEHTLRTPNLPLPNPT